MSEDLRDQLQQTLGDAYRIERELGGGGMSRVFLALETSLGREVVVKVLLPELAAGVSVERFRREIQLAAQLQHPHIVPLLAAGQAGGLPYFTMPFVHGESLRARLVRDGDLPVSESIRILRDIASALAYAHAQGVVHRDIKPDNVLLSHGVAVVTDFGVAKALTVSTGPGTLAAGGGITSMGITLGTPAYMAPEQASGDPNMDHRVDVYAFGVTAYEMLTGEPVFTGRTPQAVLGAHLAALPEPITSRRPGLPPLFALLIMKCLEKRPSDRPQTAGDIMNALDMLTTPSGGTVPIAALPRPGAEARPASRWQRIATVAALAAAAVAGIWVWQRQAEPPEPPAAAAVPAPAAAPVPGPPSPVVPPPETTAADAAPAEATSPPAARPVRPEPRPSRRRAEPITRAPLTADEIALMARLRTDARAARARAVGAGAPDSMVAEGDARMARAESLSAVGRTAAAAAQLSTAAALWSDAAAAARTAQAARMAEPPADTEPEAPAEPPVRAPAPTPPPGPVPQPRAQPPADPAPEIRALFGEYAAAIEARSVAAIRRAYPGLQPQQAQEWEDFFRGVSQVQVELNVSDIRATGDAGEARVAGVYVFIDPGTHRPRRENVAFRASMRREAGHWRIVSLR